MASADGNPKNVSRRHSLRSVSSRRSSDESSSGRPHPPPQDIPQGRSSPPPALLRPDTERSGRPPYLLPAVSLGRPGLARLPDPRCLLSISPVYAFILGLSAAFTALISIPAACPFKDTDLLQEPQHPISRASYPSSYLPRSLGVSHLREMLTNGADLSAQFLQHLISSRHRSYLLNSTYIFFLHAFLFLIHFLLPFLLIHLSFIPSSTSPHTLSFLYPLTLSFLPPSLSCPCHSLTPFLFILLPHSVPLVASPHPLPNSFFSLPFPGPQLTLFSSPPLTNSLTSSFPYSLPPSLTLFPSPPVTIPSLLPLFAPLTASSFPSSSSFARHQLSSLPSASSVTASLPFFLPPFLLPTLFPSPPVTSSSSLRFFPLNASSPPPPSFFPHHLSLLLPLIASPPPSLSLFPHPLFPHLPPPSLPLTASLPLSLSSSPPPLPLSPSLLSLFPPPLPAPSPPPV
ncbi:hypothetical protein C7M84_023063 [Penaeus vannamei]|uniref:Uncharacterized protein n=1 Tax=Penaeus vannamei TaxID=6689 RepID=A0A3R7NCU2_PENVA|nr:hypothetical protein C7M84_023063 [Penaeus vannamei]